MENPEFAVADIQVSRTKLGAAPVDIVAAGFQAKKRQAIDLTPARMGFEQVQIAAFPCRRMTSARIVQATAERNAYRRVRGMRVRDIGGGGFLQAIVSLVCGRTT